MLLEGTIGDPKSCGNVSWLSRPYSLGKVPKNIVPKNDPPKVTFLLDFVVFGEISKSYIGTKKTL